MKKLLWGYLVRFLFGAIALGLGIWYVSSSLSGASLTYTSMDSFLSSIGAADGNIANANGCFLCRYVNDLFVVLGDASELFWNAVVDHLWILMVVGFGIFLFIHTIKHLHKAMMDTTKLDTSEKKLDFGGWFDTVWRQGVRVMIVGALIGAFGMGGAPAIKTLGNITIQPVMYVGTQLSLAATGMGTAAKCEMPDTETAGAMAGLSNSFMCIVGNINSVMLAGAAGGFALMNYAWMGLGGGAFTWIAGLLVVIMFMIVGFDLFFQILSIIFKLVFLVIFMPFIAAAAAFEKTWKMASGILSGAITTLVDAAVKVIGISLKVAIMYAIIFFAADDFFPGPSDGYSAILPPLLVENEIQSDATALSIRNVFATCEARANINGEIDKDEFRACFDAEKVSVEARYPGAFDFMRDGWGFLLMMIGLFFIYTYVLNPRIDNLLKSAPKIRPFNQEKDAGGLDNFGGELKKFGKLAWKKPQDWADKLIKEK